MILLFTFVTVALFMFYSVYFQYCDLPVYFQYYDLAADVLAENAHLTYKYLTPVCTGYIKLQNLMVIIEAYC